MKVGLLASLELDTELTNPRLQVPASLRYQDQFLPLSALIDSGAEDSFISHQYVQQANIPIEPLQTPLRVTALDGHLLAEITHQTAPVYLVLSGNHCENIQLKVMSATTTPLILGFPWLVLHNPQIDWTRHTILSWSAHCHSECLRSAVPPTKNNPTQ